MKEGVNFAMALHWGQTMQTSPLHHNNKCYQYKLLQKIAHGFLAVIVFSFQDCELRLLNIIHGSC